MARTPSSPPSLDPAAVADFQSTLLKSTHMITVLGAGLSVASGLPTYRGAGSLWRNHDATQLTTPAAFRHDPGLVRQFNTHWRRLAQAAAPNQTHYTLAALARKVSGFTALTQNVDNLSPRAAYPLG